VPARLPWRGSSARNSFRLVRMALEFLGRVFHTNRMIPDDRYHLTEFARGLATTLANEMPHKPCEAMESR